MTARRWETRRFLILVKSYPNPSASWQEVVCVAAMRDDGVFVRLFPIPFRTLEESKRFKKWQWITARVIKAADDHRPESYKVDVSSIELGDVMPPGDGWAARWKAVGHLVSPSLEEREASRVANGTSLGLIRPRRVIAMYFEDEPSAAWTPDEEAKLLGAPGARELFGNAPPGQLLEKLPVRFRYYYSCTGTCGPHSQLFIDWEIGQCWRQWRWKYRTRAELEDKIRERYVDIPEAKQNLCLFLGTVHRFPGTWMVIGQTQPRSDVLDRR